MIGLNQSSFSCVEPRTINARPHTLHTTEFVSSFRDNLIKVCVKVRGHSTCTTLGLASNPRYRGSCGLLLRPAVARLSVGGLILPCGKTTLFTFACSDSVRKGGRVSPDLGSSGAIATQSTSPLTRDCGDRRLPGATYWLPTRHKLGLFLAAGFSGKHCRA